MTQPLAGNPVYSDAVLRALNRRIATTTGDTDLTAATYASVAAVENVVAALVAGRTYRVRYVFNMSFANAGDRATVRLRDASGSAGGAQISYITVFTPAAGVVVPGIVECDYLASATGNKTFQVTCERGGLAASTLQFRGAASQPRSLTVEYVSG